MATDDRDPDSSPNPQSADELSLGAHEALVLLANTGLSQFFECIPATVWTTDTHLALTFAQGAILRNLQMAPDNVLGRTLQEIVLDGREDHPLIHGHLTALAGHETSVRVEWGGILYNARIAPLRDASGTIIGCVGSHQQIGWLPDDDGLLRESDMRLRRIIDSNMIGIVFLNDEGRITETNEAFLHLAGYTREDLVADGISWPALTPVEFHGRQLQAIDEVRQTGRCTPFEVDLIRRDGRRVPVLVGGARLSARRREGVAFVLDMSERHQLRRRLSAELACADAMLAAATPEGAANSALAALCTSLDWDAAQFWCRSASGELHALASAGAPDATPSTLDALARRAMASAVAQRTADDRVVAWPVIVDDVCASAIVVTRRADRQSDPATDDTTRAIGVRIQKFLNKTA
ncbi:MAG: PAS domain-containing protein [Vicinamibacterales bacterium]